VPQTAAVSFDAGAPAQLTFSTGSGFDGLLETDNNPALEPPDPQVAAGPVNIIEMVNQVGRVYNRSGGAVNAKFSLPSFFNLPSGYFSFDPSVAYDAASGRFFAVMAAENGSTNTGLVLVAVSATSDPAGVWQRYSFTRTGSTPDFPHFGWSDDKFVVTVNGFAPVGCSSSCTFTNDYWVMDKADLLAGGTIDFAFTTLPCTSSCFSAIQPAKSLGPTSALYMAGLPTAVSTTTLTVFTVTGTAGAANVSAASSALTITTSSIPPDALQSGGSLPCAPSPPSRICIGTNDNRFLGAVWRGGHLWLSGTTGCLPDATTRACLKLIEVQTSGPPAIERDLTIGAANNYYYYPAISIMGDGTLAVVFDNSSASEFASIRALTIPPGQAPEASAQLKAGVALYTGSRWGDYQGAALDPASNNRVWVVGEYAGSGGNWSTWIASVSVPDSVAPSNPTPSSTSHTIGISSVDRRLVIVWPAVGQAGGASDDNSGVNGYSWSFTPASDSIPDMTVDGAASVTGASSPLLVDGDWWFHIRTRDNAGNWSGPVHLGPFTIAGVSGTVWYFAEGFTGNGWQTYTYFLNDGTDPTTVEATYLLLGGATVTKTFVMAGQTRKRLFANNTAEGPGNDQAFGMRIVSDHPITAQQALVDTVANLGHGSVGSKVLSTSWYFAEGFTGNGWLTFISATNPSDVDADVTTTYHKTDGTSTEVTKTVSAHSRETFAGHEDVPGSAFSVEVHSTVPIVSQEVLIDSVGLLAHATVGSTTLAAQWYFAEGYTGDSWLTFISVGNLGTSDANVTATYNLFGGSPVSKSLVVPPGTRATFAGHETETGVGPGQSFGVSVSSDVDIVSQEVLIDPKTGVALAHGVMGSLALGTTFTFAGGTGEPDWLTFVSVTNPGATAGTVTATYYFDSGSPVVRSQPIAANQRITFANTDGTGPGVLVPYAVKITSTVPVVSQEVVIDLTRYLAFSAVGTTN
jgi:hypothetical protein